MNVLSVGQFNDTELKKLFSAADRFRSQLSDSKQRLSLASTYSGRQLCTLFYEPSTRTRISFEKAAANLGITLIGTENASESSSASKGETLEDTFRVLDGYGFDIIVLRHPETGAAKRAAGVSKTPIINAGDGKGEHPTQALLDAYTIFRQFGRLHDLRIVIGGDLAHGRTVRSLVQLLAQYKGNHLYFVSIPALGIGSDIKDRLLQAGIAYTETTDMHQVLRDADVVYWTRLQKERLMASEEAQTGGYIIDANSLKILPAKAIIMHPLPRVDEIDAAVDNDPRARYFDQAANGLYIRMALINHILGDAA